MKKPSVKLDSAKLKNALIQHVEKIVLGIVLVVVVGFVYAGYNLPGLDAVPKDLSSLSEQTTQVINDPNNWKGLFEERNKPLDLESQLNKAVAANDPTGYRLVMPWKKPDFPRLSPRTDPELLAPINLKVVPITGPVAYYKTEGDTDPLGLDLGMGGGMMGAEGMMSTPGMPLAPKADTKKKKSSKKASRRNAYDPMGSPSGEEFMTPGMEGMPGMEASPEMSYVNTAPPYYPEAVRGYRPRGAAVAKPVQAMVVMAVVPFEKQIEEYEKSLAESLEYDILRDSPRYLQFYVERADVTGDPAAEPQPEDWKRLGTNAALWEARKWEGFPQEILDPNYLDPVPIAGQARGNEAGGMAMPQMAPQPGMNPGMSGGAMAAPTQFGVLTHPAPPFMLRDLWEILTHPDVPKLQPVTSLDGRTPGGPGGPFPLDSAPPSDIPMSGPGMGPFQQPGMAGMPGMPGMPGMGGSPTMGMMGMEGMMPGMGGAATAVRPKYKLIRYTDMTVEPGHVYRYRLSVLLEDPNNPKNFLSPPAPSLDPKVLERVRDQQAQDTAFNQKNNGMRQTYWRQSPFSEASAPVSLPATGAVLTAVVDPPATAPIKQGAPRVPSGPAKAKAIAVSWDPTRAADLAAEKEVYRGSYMSFKKAADTFHPTLLQFTTIEEAEIRTGAIVVDMEGGETIPLLKGSRDRKALAAPSELLVFDASGKLMVHDELDDIEEIRKFTKPPEEKVDPKKLNADQFADPMAEGLMGGFEDVMGPQPRRGRRGRMEMP